MPLQTGSERFNMKSCSPKRSRCSPVRRAKKNKKPAKKKSSSSTARSRSCSEDHSESKGREPGHSKHKQGSASSKPEVEALLQEEEGPSLDPLDSASDETLRGLLVEQLVPEALPVGRLYRPGLIRTTPSSVFPAHQPRPIAPGLISHGSKPKPVDPFAKINPPPPPATKSSKREQL